SEADYPSIKDNLQVFSAVFDQRLRDNLRVEYGYRFERFNGTNFKFDDVSVIPPDGTNNVMLRNRVDDYKAHVFLSRLVLEF
ncbi:MAG: MtrB/PioB family outer membrane beta-barrel protein, partial [Deltaproteobacteria bacterium]|nr:MtrB/PioB family outer membrane beta-barrel protein [Deltaproteobacteria bacterium]